MLEKVLLIAFSLLVVIAACAFFYIGPRNVIGILTYGRQARDGDLQDGDVAPTVTLVALDGTSQLPITNWIGQQPLVMVFGSFT